MPETKYYYGELNEPEKGMVIKEYVHIINRFRFNWHEQMELMIVTSGCLEACVDGAVYYLEEDDLLFINSNQGHATLLKKPGTHALVLHLDPMMFGELVEDGKKLNFHCRSDAATRGRAEFQDLRRLAASILLACVSQEPGAVYRIRGYTQLLLARLAESFPPEQVSCQEPSGNKKQDRVLKQILKYSEKHYNQKITMQDLSELTGYNQTYLSTLFKKKTGIGYYEYLTRIRLRYGIHEMNKTAKTILEIALDVGFSDIKSFTQAFKKYFLKTPQQYRAEIRTETSPVIDQLVREYVPLTDAYVDEKLRSYAEGMERMPPPAPETGAASEVQYRAEAAKRLDDFYQEMKKILL